MYRTNRTEELVLQGIPENMRGELWLLFSGEEHTLHTHHTHYTTLHYTHTLHYTTHRCTSHMHKWV